MSRIDRSIFFVVAFAIAGCSNDPSRVVDGGSGGDAGPSGGARAPFTTGVSTLAGWSDAGYLDGSRDVNLMSDPVNVVLGANGVLYVADFNNGKLRAVDARGNTTTAVSDSMFSRPFGMAFGTNGTLYVSTDNDPNGNHTLMTGTIWAVDVTLGTATPIAVGIGRPRGLAALADGRIAAADDLHQVIETIDPASGVVTPLAGTWDLGGFAEGVGAGALFSTPYGLVQRADGKLVVCDFDNSQLRLVGLDGTVSTYAGTIGGFADGTLASARFDQPQGIAMAANGDLFVTDLGNNRVRRISAGMVTTIAGDGTQGYLDADDPLAAELYGLEGLAVSPDGSMVYVADGTRGDNVPFNRVRQIELVP